ncbi:hypothetical protein ENSA5_50060 [Enhygromyxa salina]|uniref:CcmD family protein n=1 Tax=Enhygromyxa salina TaxID=215803 RepID=A0A2S9XHN6_9BACT|nr:hypothetical protein [Enhygromyxa salina]PRP92375.1 hypothetical protein ENSA5_50060 [Enhygromyxa salina]
MNELELEQPEGQRDAETPEVGTKKVEGRDPKTVRLKRAYEAEVENKVASDYSHIVWAYGIIWALFAIYGVLLWRRASAQKADLAALQAKLSKSTPKP